MKTRVIFCGGFLGAGKTTFLYSVAKILHQKGFNVGLITNDQAAELVDTAFLESESDLVAEVSGSCFCCNFHGLTEAIEHLIQNKGAQIILAEPVGSCTDLSATLVQPLKDKFKDTLDIAPLSVLADPSRLIEIISENDADLHTSAAYIYKKQLEEADLILINKSDTLDLMQQRELIERTSNFFNNEKIYLTSGLTGEGLETWLDEALTAQFSGNKILEIDYDIYAEGEAVLGWVNSSYDVLGELKDPKESLEKLLEKLLNLFIENKAAIGHVKLMLKNNDDEFIVGNLVKNTSKVSIRGQMEKFEGGKLTINARVQMEPEDLYSLIESGLQLLRDEEVQVLNNVLNQLKPGYPTPTYRYLEKVE